jgi:hypothetical protein
LEGSARRVTVLRQRRVRQGGERQEKREQAWGDPPGRATGKWGRNHDASLIVK